MNWDCWVKPGHSLPTHLFVLLQALICQERRGARSSPWARATFPSSAACISPTHNPGDLVLVDPQICRVHHSTPTPATASPDREGSVPTCLRVGCLPLLRPQGAPMCWCPVCPQRLYSHRHPHSMGCISSAHPPPGWGPTPVSWGLTEAWHTRWVLGESGEGVSMRRSIFHVPPPPPRAVDQRYRVRTDCPL